MNNSSTTTTPTPSQQTYQSWMDFTQQIAAQVAMIGQTMPEIQNMNLQTEIQVSAQQTYQALASFNEQLDQADQAVQTGAACPPMPSIALPPLPAASTQHQGIITTWQAAEPVFSEAIAQLPAGSPFLQTLQAIMRAFMTLVPRVAMATEPNA